MPSDEPNTSPLTNSNETLAAPARTAILAFGEYDVIGEIGEGGMGRVYKAMDRKLGRFVAVKVLRSTDPFECSRFRGEAEMIAMLDHPNIIKIFAIETSPDGRPYLVLEFAEGGSLDRELAGHPQEPRRAAEMMETIARAVHFAHEKGVIHRDLKPANVLRGKDKALKLTDFGLAKEMEVSSGMTPSGAVMGTPSYMAPEQAEGKLKQLGPATDVYGLGAILYELLTGRPPFRGVNMVDTLEQVRWAEPAPPSRLVPRLHRDLGTICLKCLQKSPARRYQTAGELADDLRRWLNGETIAARAAPSWERLVRQVRRRPWEAATIAASVLLVVLLVFGWVVMQRKAAEELRHNEQEAAEAKVREEQTAAEHKLRDTEKLATDRILAEQTANAKRLRELADGSLRAIRRINALVSDGGELSRMEGLQPLHAALMTYYEELSKQAEDGYDPAELADGFVVIGDLYRRTGDKSQARAAYEKAEALCRVLAESSPKARRAFAKARLKAGRIAIELGDDTATQAACDDAQKLWERVRAESAPGERDEATRQLAEVWHLRGELLAQKREFDKSSAAYQTAIDLRRELVADNMKLTPQAFEKLLPPARKVVLDHLRDLGRGYGYHGDVLTELNIADADRAYWNSHAIREQVERLVSHVSATGADASDARQQLARSWGNFADFQTRAGVWATARHFAAKSLEEQRKLVKDNPNNVEYRLDLCGRLNQIAELDLLPEDRNADEIKVLLEEAQAFLPRDDAAGKYQRSRGTLGTLAGTHVLLAQLYAGAKPDAARRQADLALDMLSDLCREKPGVSVSPTNLFKQATAMALLAELDAKPLSDKRWQDTLDVLERAVVEKRYRDKHPDNIKRLPAFRALKNDERFNKILDKLRS